jgi:phosphomannomutase
VTGPQGAVPGPIVPDDLRARAEAWCAADPDPTTQAEVLALLDAGDAAGLHDRFDAPLLFGTAGLRGAVGAGPARMSRLTVRHATAGVARWLAARDRHGAVVVGRDARHGSEAFARDTASVFAGAGLRVHWFDEPLPTPVVAFAIRHLDAVAGVVITASHNPAADNGYKLYLGDGAQIVPPVDDEIADFIDEIRRSGEVPLADARSEPADAILEAYLAGATRVLSTGTPRELRVVYTAMHGVGSRVVRAALALTDFDAAHEVPEQAEPDPDFPTVAFPNPEEPGALDLALALASEVQADVVLANDPDADRLAVAVPIDADHRAWRALTGNELGVLLADHLLRRGEHGPDDVLATTVVSSRLLRSMAVEARVAYEETLTGFKWVVRAPGPGQRLLFGYEEALGYCVASDLVRDKDGITAALLFLELAAVQRRDGATVLDRLDDLHRRFGAHVAAQRSQRLTGADWLARVTATMDALRADPPTSIGGLAVEGLEDLLTGERLPPSDVLIWDLDGARLVVRPSGTEPKVKCYAEAVVPVTGSVADARAVAAARVDEVLAGAAMLLGERGLS